MDWMHTLQPAKPAQSDLSALSEDESVILERFGIDALGWGQELGERVVQAIQASTPGLDAQPALTRLLTRGATSSAMRAMRMVGREELEPITPEGADVSRDWARRGLDLAVLLRSIRVGTAAMASAHIDHVIQVLDDVERASEIRRLSELFFAYIERFSSQMSDEFAAERDRWLASQAAERLVLVSDLIAHRPVDVTHLQRVLHYDLSRTHVAVIAWTQSQTTLRDRDAELKLAALDELHALGATDSIVIPLGLGASWAWGTIDGSQPSPAKAPPHGVFTASGQPHHGIDGFIRAHREAGMVEHLMRLAPAPVSTSLRHADVELAVMLAADLDNARHFVRRQLGDLATDEPRTGQLRGTLRRYLDSEKSISAVAEAEFTSRNTVTYRIKQAESLTGHRIAENRVNLQAALVLVEHLGSRVLLPRNTTVSG